MKINIGTLMIRLKLLSKVSEKTSEEYLKRHQGQKNLPPLLCHTVIVPRIIKKFVVFLKKKKINK